MKKRGIFFSTDAFVALSIIFLTVIIAFPISKEIKRESYLQYDLIQTLDSLKVGELAGTPSHLITDPNQSLLEQIGEFYTQGKLDEAKELAGIAQSINPQFRKRLRDYVKREFDFRGLLEQGLTQHGVLTFIGNKPGNVVCPVVNAKLVD